MRGLKNNVASLRKKGQGLSLNTVVIAVIVIIVLLLLIAIFVLGIGDFEKNRNVTQSCNKEPKHLTDCSHHDTLNDEYKLTTGNYEKGACCIKK